MEGGDIIGGGGLFNFSSQSKKETENLKHNMNICVKDTVTIIIDNNYFTISCLAQCYVEGGGGGGNRGRGLTFIFHLMGEGLLEGGLNRGNTVCDIVDQGNQKSQVS